MLSVASAWIAARLRRTGARLISGLAIVGTAFVLIGRIKRKAYKSGKSKAVLDAKNERLETALKEGQDHAEINEAMQHANAHGPRSRDDVLKRLRNDED